MIAMTTNSSMSVNPRFVFSTFMYRVLIPGANYARSCVGGVGRPERCRIRCIGTDYTENSLAVRLGLCTIADGFEFAFNAHSNREDLESGGALGGPRLGESASRFASNACTNANGRTGERSRPRQRPESP